MRRKASRTDTSAVQALADCIVRVEESRESLLAAAPGRRGAGAPVAEALAAFEEHLGAARSALRAWPAGVAESDLRACEAAIAESFSRAERLRLEASPEGYEQLYLLLGEIIDPLDEFREVAERLIEPPPLPGGSPA